MLRINLFRDVSDKALGIVGGLAFLVLLVGWGLNIDWLVRLRANAHAMVPSTTICFIMACGAAYLLTENAGNRRVMGMFMLGAVAAIAGINIVLGSLLYGMKLEELFGVNIGLDDRMATGTSLVSCMCVCAAPVCVCCAILLNANADETQTRRSSCT